MTRRKGAKQDRAVREARFAEEEAFGQALRKGDLVTKDTPHYQPRMPSGFAGIDYEARMHGMIIQGANPRIDDDCGATISSLDWDEKSYQRRKVAGGSSLTTTSTGGKRLHAAGPGLPEQAKQVAK